MFYFKHPFIYILGLVFPVLLFSQTQVPNFNFQKLTLEDGLTDDRANSFIFQDSKGFIWISSIDGLNRFDGSAIKTYRFKAGMTDKNIQSNFFEDNKNNIWFSTYESINCYVRKEDSIHTFQVQDSLGIPISKEYRVFHLDTTKNRLWLNASDQIFGLEINNPKSYFTLPHKITAYDFTVQNDDKGNLNKIVASPWWYGSGIDFFYIQDTILIKHKKHLQDFDYIKQSIFLEDSLWFFYKKDQLLLFNEFEPKKTIILQNEFNYVITNAAKFNEDCLLLSTINNGLWLYNWRIEKYIKQWKQREADRFSLISKHPRDIHLLDSFIWLYHANKGIDYSFLHNLPFENPLQELIKKQVEVSSIAQDNKGTIVVGTKREGIYFFSKDGQYIHHISHPLSKSDLSELWQVLPNHKGDWIATTSNAIYIIDPEKMVIKQVLESNDNSTFRYMVNVFPHRFLVSINSAIKELFINQKGEYYFDGSTELPDSKGLNYLQFFHSSNNILYVPYSGSELWVYKATYQGLQLIKKIKCNLEFFGFCESKKYSNTIWAATSKGLVKIENDTSVQFVMEQDALLSNINTYGVVEDNNGMLWISSNQGLFKYDDEVLENNVIQFNEIDGLSGDFFSLYNSTLLTENGEVWLCNNKGLVRFDPNKIKPYYNLPKVYIDELLINDTKVYKGIGEQENLELNYNANTLTFDVLAINLIKPESNRIQYRLTGYDDTWLSVDRTQKIRYTKIPAGKYTFEVKAVDAYGNESELKKLPIKIHPPFWQTWWFYTLSALLFCAIMYGIYRYRLQQLIKEEEKKTAFAQLETQLVEEEMKALRAQMNPHFLFNAMNSIKGIIIRKEEKKAADYLTKFSSLLRGILNNSEKQKIILSKEIEALRLYIELEALRFTQNFNYQIQIDKEIDTGFTRIPPLVLQPFVENAIWHGLIPKTEGMNKLSINIYKENDFVVFEVEDNGVGRKESAKSRKPSSQKSMGIGITQKRIEMLHHENEVKIIDLVNSVGKALGTKVIIKIFAPE